MQNGQERYPVKIGIITLPRRMTLIQAQRYGERRMPRDLKSAGFEAIAGLSDPEIHGGTWIRVNYRKRIGR
jgi:hypothetical protein